MTFRGQEKGSGSILLPPAIREQDAPTSAFDSHQDLDSL